ncbi:helix-turn-helix domain-containing protein [Photorhabdus heterorhabditis]|uniref:helix-turn-helix domain-containing protein n=1 Tax=Photorhabdus heterorhabditis TaxID=880156 RepID=UPI001C2728CC|nr:helix-turn-helix transcriptional regulator [Photorhabdus heterorhabditis]
MRQAINISRNDLSKLSSISRAALSKPESVNPNPSIDTADAITIVLRLPCGDLPAGNNEQYPYLGKCQSMKGYYAKNINFCIGLSHVT